MSADEYQDVAIKAWRVWCGVTIMIIVVVFVTKHFDRIAGEIHSLKFAVPVACSTPVPAASGYVTLETSFCK